MLGAKHHTKPKGITLIISMQGRVRPFAFLHADMVLSGRRQPCWFGFGITVAGGNSKVSGRRREEDKRSVLGPRTCSSAREGLRSRSV